MYKNSPESPHSSKSIRRPLAVTLLVIMAVIAVAAIYFVRHKTHEATVPVTASQNTKGENLTPTPAPKSPVAPDVSTPQNNTPATQPGDTKANNNSSASLSEPTGNFVSAHYNVPVTAALSSVCNTTSGATCQIKFTSGASIHSLPSQPTDRGGAVYWNSWTPASIGLTPGTWQVQAVATLSGQSKVTTDALNLEVK